LSNFPDHRLTRVTGTAVFVAPVVVSMLSSNVTAQILLWAAGSMISLALLHALDGLISSPFGVSMPRYLIPSHRPFTFPHSGGDKNYVSPYSFDGAVELLSMVSSSSY